MKWFKTYLWNRKQVVEVTCGDGSKYISKCRSISTGVPQGSILDPMLFTLYCADIVNNIKHCKHHIYADDIQLCMSFKPENIDIDETRPVYRFASHLHTSGKNRGERM